MCTENVSKEVVIAIPMAFIIQRNDKQVASLQGLQHHFAVFPAGDCIAQRTAEPIEDGRLQQEAPYTFGLPLQDLFHQIVHDVTVIAGKG
jgi:hypothetical protein